MEQKRKEINGVTYLVTQLDGSTALKIHTQLIKILGPAVDSLFSEGDVLTDIKSGNIENLIKLLKPILLNFDDNMVYNFILSLFQKNVFIEVEEQGIKIPKKLDFDLHFAGKILNVWPVIMFILQTNFSTGE